MIYLFSYIESVSQYYIHIYLGYNSSIYAVRVMQDRCSHHRLLEYGVWGWEAAMKFDVPNHKIVTYENAKTRTGTDITTLMLVCINDISLKLLNELC